MAYRKGEFPEAFERLCAMSIKPVSSLRFKRDCLAAWERRVAQGFAPEHIIEAYCAYAKSYWMRNGDDATLAKNLARWLEGEGGLSAYADEPIPPDLLDADGEPLDMPGLAQADPDFAKLWRRVETQRCVIRSTMAMGGELPPEEDVLLPPMYFPPFTPMIHNRSRQPAPAGYANVFPPLSAPPPNLSRNARASRARALSEPG